MCDTYGAPFVKCIPLTYSASTLSYRIWLCKVLPMLILQTTPHKYNTLDPHITINDKTSIAPFKILVDVISP